MEHPAGHAAGHVHAGAREHFWDFARAFYLMLGIPFHAAVVYSTHHDWIVASPERSQILTFLADYLHTFRMPGFFLIAGYFSIMLLARRGAVAWVSERLVRLGVPLVAATLTLLPFQMLVQSGVDAANQGTGWSGFVDISAHRLTHFDEPWISHLWFLYVLIALSVALAAAAWLPGLERFKTLYRYGVELAYEWRWASFGLAAAICAGLAFLLPAVYAAGGSKAQALVSYVQYFPYYLLGVAVYLSPMIRERYLRFGWLALVLGSVLAFNSMMQGETPWSRAIFMLSGLFAALLITAFIARMAWRYFDRPNAWVRKVSDASFTIYLFHQPLVVVLAALFVYVDWPPVLEFCIVVPIVAITSYAIHLAVVSNPITLFLFNGVRRKKGKPVRRAAGRWSGKGEGAATPRVVN